MISKEIEEALAAVKPAENRIGDRTIVAIELDRDPAVSGRYMTGVGRGWSPLGKAVAIKAGKVVAANHVYGMWADGGPKVTACRAVYCRKCGKEWGMPHAIWAAKDRSRESGNQDALKSLGGWAVIKQHGICMECNSKLYEDVSKETESLEVLKNRALRALERMETIPEFMPPQAFDVVVGNVPAKDYASAANECWRPFVDIMLKQGKSLVLHRSGCRDDVIIYNPGFWLGTVDGCDDPRIKGLFFSEAERRDGRFNPANVDGL